MSDGTYKLLGKSRQGSWSQIDTLTRNNLVVTLSDSEKSSVRVMYEDGKGMTSFGKPAKVRAPFTYRHVFVLFLYMLINIPSLAFSLCLFPVATCVYNLIRCRCQMRDSFVPAVIYSTVTFVLSGLGGLFYGSYETGEWFWFWFWMPVWIFYIGFFIGYGFLCYFVTKYVFEKAFIVKWQWLPPPLHLIADISQCLCDF